MSSGESRSGKTPLGFEVTVERKGDDSTVVRCTGELDLATCRHLEPVLEGLTGSDVSIDTAGLRFIDSTGVRLLLRTASRLDRAGVTWRIVPSDVLLRVASILGVTAALHLEPNHKQE